MEAAFKALVALSDSGDLVSYSATGSELCDAYAASTPWGRAVGESNAEAWDDLAFRLQEAMRMGNVDALAAYEALEEEDLMQRLGVDACEVLSGESGNAGLCRSAIIEEIESRLHRTLPAIAEVRRRLGDDAAEEYRCDIETLEERGGISPSRGTSPRRRRRAPPCARRDARRSCAT